MRLRARDRLKRPEELYAEAFQRLRAAGVPRDTQMLGCGMQGCAWLLEDGRVLKVTFVRAEADGAVWAGTFKHACLPYIDGVFRLPLDPPVRVSVNEDPLTEMFAILREDLADINAPSHQFTWFLRRLNADMGATDYKAGTATTEQLIEILPSDTEKAWARQLLDFLAWCQRRKVQFLDIASFRNFGLRGDQIVLRDLGFAVVPEQDRNRMALAGEPLPDEVMRTIDPKIREVMRDLNALPFVIQTTFSCAGYGPKGGKARGTYHRNMDCAHAYFGFTYQPTPEAERFLQAIDNLQTDDGRRVRLSRMNKPGQAIFDLEAGDTFPFYGAGLDKIWAEIHRVVRRFAR